MVLNNGDINGALKPADVFYSVTCQSNDGEILMADLNDIWKLLKNERRITNFMKEQYCQKFPDQPLADVFQDQVFESKIMDMGPKSETDRVPELNVNMLFNK